MLITAHVLFWTFGYLAIGNLYKYTFGSNGISVSELGLLVFSTIIVALSAGVIWGGLL